MLRLRDASWKRCSRQANLDRSSACFLGYTYREDYSKSPHIDIQVLPGGMALDMERSHAEWGDQVIHEFDGCTFALPIPDDDDLLDGYVLTHSEEGFVLVRERH